MRHVLTIVLVALALAGARGATAIAIAPTAAELDTLLAPVALYPDQLLGEIGRLQM